MMHKIVVC